MFGAWRAGAITVAWSTWTRSPTTSPFRLSDRVCDVHPAVTSGPMHGPNWSEYPAPDMGRHDGQGSDSRSNRRKPFGAGAGAPVLPRLRYRVGERRHPSVHRHAFDRAQP